MILYGVEGVSRYFRPIVEGIPSRLGYNSSRPRASSFYNVREAFPLSRVFSLYRALPRVVCAGCLSMLDSRFSLQGELASPLGVEVR